MSKVGHGSWSLTLRHKKINKHLTCLDCYREGVTHFECAFYALGFCMTKLASSLFFGEI